MAGRYLLGVASVALFAMASTGSARAADVMPVVVPLVTPAVVVAAGPKIEINSEHWLEIGIFPGNGYDLVSYHDLDIKVTAASGVGFQFVTSGVIDNLAPFDIDDLTLAGRVFLSRGDAEIGVYAGLLAEIPGGIDFTAVGADFSIDNDRLELDTYVQANFDGGFDFLSAGVDLTVHATERLDLNAGGALSTDFGGGGAFLEAWAGAQLDFGLLAPYAGVYVSNGMERFTAELGVELEHQIGNGPLSLLGYAEFDFGTFGPAIFAGVGIKYSIGGDE